MKRHVGTLDIRLCVFVGGRVGAIFVALLLSFTLILKLKNCGSMLMGVCHVPYKENKLSMYSVFLFCLPLS